MKVAMIGQKGIPTRYGGIERHVEALAVRLGKRGHQVTAYARAWYVSGGPDGQVRSHSSFSKGVTVIVTPTVRSKHLDAIVHTFTSTLHAIRSKADIIHYHGVGPSLLSWIPRVFAPRIKVVATLHCIDKNHQKWGWFARMILALGERTACLFPHETIAVSKTLQAYGMHRFGGDLRYIPNGVDLPQSRIGSKTLAVQGLAKDEYILFVARLVRHKGAHHLIAAYRALQKRGLTRGKKLAIVGDSAFTDEYVREIKTLAHGDKNIVFTGYLSGKPLEEIFANAYLVVHPSESEGLPIAVLEAMSYGRMVLASDIPENMEVVREHGASFRNRSVEDLTRKLRAMLDAPATVAALGASAKKFVLVHYRWDDVARQTERLYAELLLAERAGRRLRAA